MRIKKLIETSERKAKKLFKNPILMPSVKTFAILTGNNPNSKQKTRKINKELNKKVKNELAFEPKVERSILDAHYPYYKVKGKYDNVENSFIVYNITLEDAKRLSASAKQQSFIFGSNKGDKLIFQFWANRYRNESENEEEHKYSYMLVDERDIFNEVDKDAENYYTQISRDFKINIPFEKFTPDEEDMLEFYNKCMSRPKLFENTMNPEYTGSYRWGARNDLYGREYRINKRKTKG